MYVPDNLSMQHGTSSDHGNAPASAAAPDVHADVRAAMHELTDAPTNMYDDVCASTFETDVHTRTDQSPMMRLLMNVDEFIVIEFFLLAGSPLSLTTVEMSHQRPHNMRGRTTGDPQWFISIQNIQGDLWPEYSYIFH